VMVLKRGRNVGERAIAETTEKEVLELIVSGVPEKIADRGLLCCSLERLGGDEAKPKRLSCDFCRDAHQDFLVEVRYPSGPRSGRASTGVAPALKDQSTPQPG
jgi:hypothetical protein